MASKKPKKTAKKPQRIQRGDREALALVLLATALFLIASFYPEPPLSGALGVQLKALARRHLGVLLYLLPFPFLFSGGLLLLGRSPARVLRATLFAFIIGALLLPFAAFLDPGLAGVWGAAVYETLKRQLGNAGFLMLALAAWAVLDVWMRHPPFWGLIQVLRRVGKAAWSLYRSWHQYREASRAWSQLRRQARGLLSQVQALLERYPDHALLADLKNDLERLARSRSSDGEEELERLRELLEEFQKQRAKELELRLKAESPTWIAELEALERLLQNPLPRTETPLWSELDERRRALQLELAAIKKGYAASAAASARDLERLRNDPSAVESAAQRFETRSSRWRDLREALDEVAARIEAWERWVGWAESQPEEHYPAAVQILKASGLVASPPRVQEEEATREATPTLSSEPAIEPKRQEEPPPSPPRPDPARKNTPTPSRALTLPTPELLDPPGPRRSGGKELEAEAAQRAEVINETLSHFNLAARVVAWARGPSVTRFEVEPAPGEKISRIAGLANDLARALAVGSVRVEAPIPGKHVIGLEVPNADRDLVRFIEALQHPAYQRSKDRLPLILGKSIDGEMWVRDLAVMPHLLIAGSTGSGKSVCVNTLVMSLLYRYLPTQLRLLMIDPKMVELTPYDGIPHLVRGVVTNPADAAGVLLGAVAHMERRYKMMSQVGARNLEQFNAKMRELGEPELPMLVIVIDELADLMITSPKEVEQAILRLAQMARATGMHLVLATQRPSVDILTSLIKVNVPARIAFAVSSSHDSRTILDSTGAERLIGQGDMLFHQPGLPKPVRLQGPFLSDREIHRVTEFLRVQEFEDAFVEAYGADFDGPLTLGVNTDAVQGELPLDFSDPYLKRAAQIVVEEGQASVSRLQRRLSVGHARAGKLMDLLEAMGIVGPHQGSKPREVLISADQIEEFFG